MKEKQILLPNSMENENKLNGDITITHSSDTFVDRLSAAWKADVEGVNGETIEAELYEPVRINNTGTEDSKKTHFVTNPLVHIYEVKSQKIVAANIGDFEALDEIRKAS